MATSENSPLTKNFQKFSEKIFADTSLPVKNLKNFCRTAEKISPKNFFW